MCKILFKTMFGKLYDSKDQSFTSAKMIWKDLGKIMISRGQEHTSTQLVRTLNFR